MKSKLQVYKVSVLTSGLAKSGVTWLLRFIYRSCVSSDVMIINPFLIIFLWLKVVFECISRLRCSFVCFRCKSAFFLHVSYFLLIIIILPSRYRLRRTFPYLPWALMWLAYHFLLQKFLHRVDKWEHHQHNYNLLPLVVGLLVRRALNPAPTADESEVRNLLTNSEKMDACYLITPTRLKGSWNRHRFQCRKTYYLGFFPGS